MPIRQVAIKKTHRLLKRFTFHSNAARSRRHIRSDERVGEIDSCNPHISREFFLQGTSDRIGFMECLLRFEEGRNK